MGDWLVCALSHVARVRCLQFNLDLILFQLHHCCLVSDLWFLCIVWKVNRGLPAGWMMYLIFLINSDTQGKCFTHPMHSWAQQLYVGRLNSDRWCPSPSGSALWHPLLPGWRPGPWSCPPCGPSVAWTAHQSGSSTRRWGWSEKTRLLKNTQVEPSRVNIQYT